MTLKGTDNIMFIKNPLIEGKFIERINRFEAYVDINGRSILVHVPNTGRCKEILVNGRKIILEERHRIGRKTPYELEFVYKGNRLISIDSQVPNKVVLESIKEGKISYFLGYDKIEREKTYKNSKFDIRLKNDKEVFYIEVKGVTLEDNGVVLFPDAPTERGLKHLIELKDVKENGMRSAIVFLIQMDNVKYFTPNKKRDPKFTEALIDDIKSGVEAYAFSCSVTENSIALKDEIPIRL